MNMIYKINGNDIHIDVTNLKDDEADWLELNDAYINFPKSRPEIIKAHLIDASEVGTIIAKETVSVEKLKKAAGADFKDDYSKYFSFDFQPNGTQYDLIYKVTDDFEIDGNCFSMPLLKGLLEKHPTVTEITIKKAEIKGSPGILFSIAGTNYYYYYDYTRIPRAL
ncbi:hypothetical protein CHU92_13685 [Flavobacterium cyanobacteriorum]|uniref:Uncharacterized protein n=2 Tax=Flavobacterium cyanobacteriorum TaxID=2022802 RepID=A0A255YWW8_9FLAO|nr:hypothetical protein CHU92_13685 [Flavobacterium cyanobacteriorum]